MYLVVNSGRMVQKIVTASGQAFSVAPSGDHTDGSWGIGSLYDGEFGINSANATLWLRISGAVYQISVSGSSGAVLPIGTSGQTLRYDSGATLVANSILKNDGTDVFIGAGNAGTGRLLSTINSLTAHNIIVKNLNGAGGNTFIEFQNSAGTEQFDIGYGSSLFQIVNTAGLGITLDTNAKVKITQNNASYYEILTLKNLNSSAPVYLVFQNAAGAEKFYAGYRQAQTRFDIMSADTTLGMAVDNTGRTLIGLDNSTYQAPDTGSMLTVDTRSGVSSYGMTLRHVANSGVAAPINWQYTNTGSTLVYYASVMGDIVSNAVGAHYGKLTVQVAVSGVMTTKLVVDSSGITTGVWLGTTIAVAKGGTGKTGIAANKMLIALATDTYSETDYQNVAEQTYAGSAPVWGGTTAPSSTTTNVYTWFRIGNQVNLKVWFKYAVAGSANSSVTFDLPSDCPTPREPSGLGATNDKLYSGSGWIDAAITGGPPASRVALKNKSASTYEILIATASVNAVCAHCNIWYEA